MKKTGMLVLVFALPGLAAAQAVDDAALKKIHVTSGRSSAWAQFNQPAVHVWLPQAENSAYAAFELADPQVVDAKGRPVELSVEPGTYDEESARKEFRILALGDPARLSGKVRVRYPVRIRQPIAGEPDDQLTAPAHNVQLPKAFVEEWKQVEITYDLPVAELLPQAQKGEPQPVEQALNGAPANVAVVVKQ